MSQDVNSHLREAEQSMQRAIQHLEAEMRKVRAGKASPGMLDGIKVDYYGTSTPLNQVANINTPDPKTISIQPWEKSMLSPIEKAIQQANIGVNPNNDGETIRLNLPPLTEERRKDLVRQVKALGENAKVSIRGIRKDLNNTVREMLKSGDITEDIEKSTEHKVQDLTDRYIKKVDEHLAAKEKEIMTV